MGSKLIELEEGILLEVEVPGDQPELIARRAARGVQGALGRIGPLLASAAASVAESWQSLDKNFDVTGAELELGLSFESEGSVYIAKAKGAATITVRLSVVPKGSPDRP